MTIITNLLVALIIIYAAYSGTKRGMIALALELNVFFASIFSALILYRPLADIFARLTDASPALTNVAGYFTAWVLCELLFTLGVRRWIVPHIPQHVELSPANRVGGTVLGTFKIAAITTLAIIVFGSLPLPTYTKLPVIQAFLPTQLVYASGSLAQILDTGLGRDFSNSLNFFTVPASPEDDKRIYLGYKITNGTVDARAETALLELLNKERTSEGLEPLSVNTTARAVARKYSAEMFAGGYFSHTSLDGKSPFDRMKEGKVAFVSAGENLALAPTVQQAHQGLMASPGHRANILSPDFRAVGIGIVDGGPYGLMITQNFTD